jgi:hypothetical protein
VYHEAYAEILYEIYEKGAKTMSGWIIGIVVVLIVAAAVKKQKRLIDEAKKKGALTICIAALLQSGCATTLQKSLDLEHQQALLSAGLTLDAAQAGDVKQITRIAHGTRCRLKDNASCIALCADCKQGEKLACAQLGEHTTICNGDNR